MYTQWEASISQRDCRQIICQRLKSINWGLFVAKRERRKREKVRNKAQNNIQGRRRKTVFVCRLHNQLPTAERREEKSAEKVSVTISFPVRSLCGRSSSICTCLLYECVSVKPARACFFRLPLNPHQPFAFTCFGPTSHLPPSHVDILFIE